MADHHRSNDSRDLDAQDLADMTRAFLAKGGNIVQCPPGASENVVYRKGGFRRRNPNDAKTAAEKPAEVTANASVDTGASTGADSGSTDENSTAPAQATESKAG